MDQQIHHRRSIARCLAVLTLASLLVTGGCVRTEHPLREAAAPIADDGLVGSWLLQDPVWGERVSEGLKISQNFDGSYLIESLTASNQEKPEVLECKLVSAGDASYFDIVAVDGRPLTDQGLIPSFLRIERKGDWIAMRCPDLESLREFVEAGTEIQGTTAGGFLTTFVKITSSSTELASFLAKHGDEVMQPRQVYRRMVETRQDSQ